MRSRRVLGLLVAATLAGWGLQVVATPSPWAARAETAQYINLVQTNGFSQYSQRDPRWANATYNTGASTGTFAQCGCVASVLASILQYTFRPPAWGWLPRPVNGIASPDFNPLFVNYSMDHSGGWYPSTPNDCTRLAKPNGLTEIAWAMEGVVGHGARTISGGIELDHRFPVADKNALFEEIMASLRQGRPVWIGMDWSVANPGWWTGRHAQVIVGYDPARPRIGHHPSGEFLVTNPSTLPERKAAEFPEYSQVHGDPATWDPYQDWWDSVFMATFYKPVINFDSPLLTLSDAPAPLDMLAVGPDGRRVGDDPVTGKAISEVSHAGFVPPPDTLNPWVTTTPSSTPAKALSVLDPAAGTWRLLVHSRAAGDVDFTARWSRPGDENIVLSLNEPAAAAGTDWKYELDVTDSGPPKATPVADFSPEPRFNVPPITRGQDVTFDASSSFDVDGAITSYTWRFSDGSTASGARVTKSFNTAGDASAELTVVDNTGRQRSVIHPMDVEPKDQDAPELTLTANPETVTGAWITSPATVNITASDPASTSVLRYRVDGPEPVPDTAAAGSSASLTVTADGRSTVTATATDVDGNSTSRSLTIQIDRQAPQVSIGFPSREQVIPELPYVTGTVSDAGVVSTTEAAIQAVGDHTWWDGSGWTGSRTWMPAQLAGARWSFEVPRGSPAFHDGTYTVQVRASDAAGNISPTETVTLTVERSGPSAISALVIPDALTSGIALATNADGVAVGWASNAAPVLTQGAAPEGWLSPTSAARVAMRWGPSGPQQLAPLRAPFHYTSDVGARAIDINDSGLAVGYSDDGTTAPGDREATVWGADGGAVSLGVLDTSSPDTAQSAAYAVNNAGVVVGYSDVARAPLQVWNRRAVVWWRDGRPPTVIQPGRTVDKSVAFGIRDTGIVVGADGTGSYDQPYTPFVWDSTNGWRTLPPLEAGRSAWAYDVSDDGSVVVGAAEAQIAPGYYAKKAVVWVNGSPVDLGIGAAFAVNDHNQVVGSFPGKLWQDGQMQDLGAVVAGSGWSLLAGTGINDAGLVTGVGTFNGKTLPFTLNTASSGSADRTLPLTTATIDPAGEWSKSDVSVTLHAADTGGSGVRSIWSDALPGGHVDTDSATIRIADEGTTVLRYYAVDRAGNTESAAYTTVRVDRNAPTTGAHVTPDAAGGWAKTATVTIDAADTLSGVAGITWWSEDGAQTTTLGDHVDIPITVSGTTTVHYLATDKAGNASQEQSATAKIDAEPPVPVVSTPPDPVTVGAIVPYTAIDNGESGLADVGTTIETAGKVSEYRLGDAIDQPGPHQLVVTATDNAGNTAAVTVPLMVVSISGPPADFVAGNTRPVADAGGPYQTAPGATLRLDGTRSADLDGQALSYRWTIYDSIPSATQPIVVTGPEPTVSFPTAGRRLVLLDVNDGQQWSLPLACRQAFTTIEVAEPTWGPVAAVPDVLWPPNHKFVTVTLRDQQAAGGSGNGIRLVVDTVTQDEPLAVEGSGSKEPDARRVSGHPDQVELRAERAGTGDGRVYRIGFTAIDGDGRSRTGVVRVTVPHDKGQPAIETAGVVVNSFA